MRLVQVRDGILEVKWTWLPFWIAVSPRLQQDVERFVFDASVASGVTESDADLDALHDVVVARLQEMFPAHKGLDEYLDSLKRVQVS